MRLRRRIGPPTSLRQFARQVSTSYWLLPGAALAAAVVLAQLSLSLDSRLTGDSFPWLRWIAIDDPASAQTILSTVAASMVTVGGSVFSVTVVALTVAANQFGQRLLRNFMRDRGNQATLGLLLATFVYALLVMREVSTLGEYSAVPSISVCIAIALAFSSVVFLIYFIHHIVSSIQVENVVAEVTLEFERSLRELFPPGNPCSVAPTEHSTPADAASVQCRTPVAIGRGGFVQTIDYEWLVEWASGTDRVVDVRTHPGAYLFDHSEIARVGPGDIDPSDEESIRAAFGVGDQATHEQDIAYSIRQLAQIGVRALSPGLNDPFTAYLCMDRLGTVLGRLLRAQFPPAVRHDADGNLRLMFQPPSFARLSSVALDEIIEYGHDSSVVVLHLLKVIARLTPACTRAEDRLALWHLADRCTELASQELRCESILREIEERRQTLRSNLLGGPNAAGTGAPRPDGTGA